MVRSWRQDRDYSDVPEAAQPDRIYQDAFRQLEEARKKPTENLEKLKKLRLPNFFKGARPVIFFFSLLLVGAGIGAGVMDDRLMGAGIGAGGGLVVAGALLWWLFRSSRAQVEEYYI